MKKVVLFLFLIASIVSAKTLVLSNSLSPPPSKSLDATLKAQLQMLQISPAETQQPDVCFFGDVSYLVSSENFKSVIPATLSVQCAVNFQVLVNKSNVRTSSGNPDVLLAAISPRCRAVLQDFSCDGTVTMWSSTQTLTQAVSPNCRDVMSMMV